MLVRPGCQRPRALTSPGGRRFGGRADATPSSGCRGEQSEDLADGVLGVLGREVCPDQQRPVLGVPARRQAVQRSCSEDADPDESQELELRFDQGVSCRQVGAHDAHGFAPAVSKVGVVHSVSMGDAS